MRFEFPPAVSSGACQVADHARVGITVWKGTVSSSKDCAVGVTLCPPALKDDFNSTRGSKAAAAGGMLQRRKLNDGFDSARNGNAFTVGGPLWRAKLKDGVKTAWQ